MTLDVTATTPRYTASRKAVAFLAAYSECGTITAAAEAAGVDRETHYHWFERDADYRLAFAAAERVAAERLEKEARRRAVLGVDEPITYKGQVTGTVKKYSDTLLIFLLKGALPDKYRESPAVQVNTQVNNGSADASWAASQPTVVLAAGLDHPDLLAAYRGAQTPEQAVAALQALLGADKGMLTEGRDAERATGEAPL